MNFGQALENLKQGRKLQRAGWNGKGLFVRIQRPDEHSMMNNPYFVIDNQGSLNTWVPSVSDCLAEDWQLVSEPVDDEAGQYNL